MFESTKVQIAAAVLAVVALVVIGNIVFAFGWADEGEAHVETHWGEATGEVYDNNRYFVGSTVGPVTLPNALSYSTDTLDTEPNTMEVQVDEALTRDGQDFSPHVSVTYQLDGDQAASFYADSEQSAPFQSTGMWEERVGERAIESAVHDGTASISALEMVESYDEEDGADMATLRNTLQEEVEQQLREENARMSPEIEIVEVRVEDANPSTELSTAFEDVAIENAEAERKLIEAAADAEAERERAQGQADAFATIVEAYGSEEAALQAEWIEAINQDDGTIIIDAEAAPILDLNEEQRQSLEEDESVYFEEDG